MAYRPAEAPSARTRSRGHCATTALAVTAFVLLASASRTPALADGGTGGTCFSAGGVLGSGGSGGSGLTGNPGSPGAVCGGGGGGGAGGGLGGSGAGLGGGAGGAGGTSASPNGQNGGDGASATGGGGGGGGFNGNGIGAAVITNVSPIAGGNGGNGGNGGPGGSLSGTVPGGGGGGAGGYGAVVTGTGTSTNASVVAGGVGGNGGGDNAGGAGNGAGGDGGVGVVFSAGAANFINSGTVNGGRGGIGVPGGIGGAGALFTASGATFSNSGTVSGGDGGSTGSAPGIGPIGRGGTGGAGAQFTASGVTFINSGVVSGGKGGGGAGSGGVGVAFTAGGATFLNLGTVSGGDGQGGGLHGSGGSGGVGVTFSTGGGTLINSGTINGGGRGSTFLSGGGAGIVGIGLTIINSGTISGSLNGGTISGSLSPDGSRANAVVFSGGTNVLELRTGSSITGNVVAFSAADTLRLGGTTDSSFDVTQIDSQYQGFGVFEKSGSSIWTLSGANATAMPWTITTGTLQANAAMAGSTMTVNAGGTLAGTGAVGPVTVNVGGTLAPGAAGASGTMTIAGNLKFQPGAFYVVRVNPFASNANVTGTAALAGTVEAAFAPGSYMVRNNTILHTAGLGGTTFDGLQTTNLPTGFDASLNYTTTDAILKLTLSPGTLEGAGLSGNQQQVATALKNSFNSGGALPPNFVTVFGLTGESLGSALRQLSGEAATAAQQGAFQLMTEFLTLMLDPFVDGRSGYIMDLAPSSTLSSLQVASADPAMSVSFSQGWTLWGSAYGGVNHTDGDTEVAGSHNLTASTGGFAAGADYRLSPTTALGFALAGGGTGWSLAQGLGGGRSDAFQAGIYGKTTFGPAYLAAAFAYTQHWMSTERISLAFDDLKAAFDAQSYGGRVEGGYRFASSAVAVTPYAAFQSQAFAVPSYSETDLSSGGFGLAYAGRTATATRTELGSRFDHALLLNANTLLVLRGKLAWAHDWVSDPSLAAAFLTLPGSTFIVGGAMPPTDLGLVSAGAELRFANGLALAAKFDGEIAGRAHTLAGSAILRYTW